MARRIPPVIPSRNGKEDKKIRELSDIRAESRNAVSSRNPVPSPAPANEIVGISMTPVLRERLEKSLRSVPDVDSLRVDEIRQALKDGVLQINADDIADAMIRLDQSFGD